MKLSLDLQFPSRYSAYGYPDSVMLIFTPGPLRFQILLLQSKPILSCPVPRGPGGNVLPVLSAAVLRVVVAAERKGSDRLHVRGGQGRKQWP